MSTSLQTSASSGQTLHTAPSYCAISQYENTFYTTRTCFDLKQFPNCPFAEKSFLQACVWKLNTFLHCSFSAAYKHHCIPKCKRPTRIKEGTAGVSNSHIDQANCELIIAVNTTSMNGTPPSSCSRVLKVTFMSQKTLKSLAAHDKTGVAEEADWQHERTRRAAAQGTGRLYSRDSFLVM